MNDKFFQLLRLAIDVSDEIPQIQPGEWTELYKTAKKQSLTALLFDGVRKIGKDANINENLLLKWMGESMMAEKRNLRVNETVTKIAGWFQKKGFRTCVLKGQGNALMYPNPLHRTAGDIDIWVSGKPRDVIRFVHTVAPKQKASYHHIDFPAVDGIPVEVHYRPCYLQSLLHNHRLQQYFLQHAEVQFSHLAEIGDKKVAVPTAPFNAVFQLVHIYNHLFQEGIGMRQLVDYYFVLENLPQIAQRTQIFKANTERTENTEAHLLGACSLLNTNQTNQTNQGDSPFVSSMVSVENNPLQRDLKWLGLWKFAGAVMWVLHEVLELDESKMIAPMDEKRGKLLLADILTGGNFGRHDKRNNVEKGTIGHNIQRFKRDLRLVKYYPAEALSEPIFRVHHYLWRMMHRYD